MLEEGKFILFFSIYSLPNLITRYHKMSPSITLKSPLARHYFKSLPLCSLKHHDPIGGFERHKPIRLVECDNVGLAPIPTQPVEGELRTIWHEMPVDILYEVSPRFSPR